MGEESVLTLLTFLVILKQRTNFTRSKKKGFAKFQRSWLANVNPKTHLLKGCKEMNEQNATVIDFSKLPMKISQHVDLRKQLQRKIVRSSRLKRLRAFSVLLSSTSPPKYACLLSIRPNTKNTLASTSSSNNCSSLNKRANREKVNKK